MKVAVPVPVRPEDRSTSCLAASGMWRKPVVWLVLITLIGAGLVVNWNWLVAAGALPVVLVALPCLAMCALHICSLRIEITSAADLQKFRR